jgi:prephenate dehydrogenase
MKTAIIGTGKMGGWFAKFCKEKGDQVILTGRDMAKSTYLGKELGVQSLDMLEAVKIADRIIVCVSISAFEEVIKIIAPHIRENQIIMDICSIKSYPVDVMHKNIEKGLVLGTHPLFGPGSKSIRHKTFILTPTNDQESAFAQEYRNWLEKEEAHVFLMSPRKHDELISVVLGLPHFLGLAACETLLEQKDFLETKKVAGTTYRMLFTLAEATTLESPDLFANLQTMLPRVKKIEELFLVRAQEWVDLVKKSDFAGMVERLTQLKQKLKNVDANFDKSYKVMYEMLEATEE